MKRKLVLSRTLLITLGNSKLNNTIINQVVISFIEVLYLLFGAVGIWFCLENGVQAG